MRRRKIVIVADVEIEEGNTDQDLSDLSSQALQTINGLSVWNLVLYEHNTEEETFNQLLDEVKVDFQYGDYRNLM